VIYNKQLYLTQFFYIRACYNTFIAKIDLKEPLYL
jgi:hypothetical protein